MTTFTQSSDPPSWQEETLPTMYDLPSEDPEEPGLPDEYHCAQPELLRQTFKSPRYSSEQIFIGTDINLYYDRNHTRWYKRPDWFVAVGVPYLYAGVDLRLSYVVWDEKVKPLVAIELLSPGTHKEDLGENARVDDAIENGTGTATPTPPGKWEVYEQILKIPYYIVYDRYIDELRFFKLEGSRYREQTLYITAPQIWIPELALGLGLWRGAFRGCQRLWARWCNAEGGWFPTPEEEAEVAKQEAEIAKQEVEIVKQEAEAAQRDAETARAALKEVERARRASISQLLAMGLTPEQVATALNLSVEEVNRDESR